MTMPRRVAAETLDHLSPEDPAAKRSRRDLVRVHRAMGTRSILARGWQDLMAPGPASAPLRVLEIGAGDGSLMLGVARLLGPRWRQVQLTLLDCQNIVSRTTLAGYAELGWTAQAHVADVLAWAARSDPQDGPPAPPRWDLVTTSLFLHHFEGDHLDAVFTAVAARADRFFACEPRRSWLSLVGSRLVGAIGANAVTREDAVLSVHAGFRADEITALWSPHGKGWQTREFEAGPFSHCFSARRAGVA